eukprot:Plantae.Rhodophyta-Rhodochaete_pulchella.ctg1263.p1 GENE.Plantae.Rhodophyta-Rhodochaete_pulchella.ctg1263~~Plantae.Rhodophyta-Rhodochaete_pulchella.ctg1263.p1  ORF type:complete len:470 (-),score=43.90 Plantae.Rhodophyta-Rhodochaete_pulchella.ctg1263:63-1265(-)
MVFTPLLAQTTTGTLDFRTVCEPIRKLQPALAQDPHEFFLCHVLNIDPSARTIQARAVDPRSGHRLHDFDVPFDYLVLAHGAFPSTFGTPGVAEHCFFLREVSDARGIRTRVLRNLALASLPRVEREERERLMHTVIVGGGPIGTEFAGDLSDFKREDIASYFPKLKELTKVTLIEPNEVLGAFDQSLRNYAARQLERHGVNIVKSVVKRVEADSVVLEDGTVVPCGLVVWGTGVGPSRLTRVLPFDRNERGRLEVDDFLRVRLNGTVLDDVYAIGDCAGKYPALAAVANQQGKYVAARLNGLPGSVSPASPFRYHHLGSLATVGRHRAVIDLSSAPPMSGLMAFILWRSAYFTMLGTMRSKMYTAVNWMSSLMFGRDFTFILESDYFRKAEETTDRNSE